MHEGFGARAGLRMLRFLQWPCAMKATPLRIAVVLVAACGSGSDGTAQLGDPCADTDECIPGSVCFDHVCVGDGDLRFSMSWSVDTDIDLHVRTPAGSEIYYGNRSAGGGTLDVDDCVGESCASPGEIHVENVVFELADAGAYAYWSVNYAGMNATAATIAVFVDGEMQVTITDTLPASPGAVGPEHVFSY